jgi:hypothetical protein
MMIVENKEREVALSGVEGLSYLSSLASSTPTITVTQRLTDQVSLGYKVVKEYIATTVSAVNGYFDRLFAREVYTDNLCVKKSDGSNVCITGDQVEQILNSSNIPLLIPNLAPVVSGTSTGDGSTDGSNGASAGTSTDQGTQEGSPNSDTGNDNESQTGSNASNGTSDSSNDGGISGEGISSTSSGEGGISSSESSPSN